MLGEREIPKQNPQPAHEVDWRALWNRFRSEGQLRSRRCVPWLRNLTRFPRTRKIVVAQKHYCGADSTAIVLLHCGGNDAIAKCRR